MRTYRTPPPPTLKPYDLYGTKMRTWCSKLLRYLVSTIQVPHVFSCLISYGPVHLNVFHLQETKQRAGIFEELPPDWCIQPQRCQSTDPQTPIAHVTASHSEGILCTGRKRGLHPAM